MKRKLNIIFGTFGVICIIIFEYLQERERAKLATSILMEFGIQIKENRNEERDGWCLRKKCPNV